MDYYCDVCDKTIAIQSESAHLQTLTYDETENCILTKHTIEDPVFFIDEIINIQIASHI